MPDPTILLIADALEAWTDVGRQLLHADRDNFVRLLLLAGAYVSLHNKRKVETMATFESKMTSILPGSTKTSA